MADEENRTRAQIDEEIRQLRRVFSAVQLLEPEQLGALAKGDAPCCSALWGGTKPCTHCVAREALDGHTRRSRLENIGNEMCEITAVWVRVEDRDCVLEMYQKLGLKATGLLVDAQEYRDMLTGIYNRRYYDEKIRDQKLTAGVALIDLDDTGFANAVYGHCAGDALMETAAAVIRRNITPKDQLIRYGGDELLLIQPEIGQQHFHRKLEQIRMQLYAAAVPGYSRLQLSARIGGVWIQDTEADDAVHRAERLMHYVEPQKNTVITSEVHAGSWTNSRQSVLIVDDSAMNRKILSEMLNSQFDTAEAASGEECLRLLEQNRSGISVVLLDIHMEGIDGFTVLEAMNQQNMLEQMPVIMISSEDNVDTVRRAFDLGASDYISRPFDARVVYQRITNTIRLYAKQRRLSAIVADQVYETEQTSQMMFDILNRVMEKRNDESRDHVWRIQTTTAMLLAHLAQKDEEFGLTQAMRRCITLAASLHDIGKMEIEDRLLHADTLTPEEQAAVQQHTVLGAELLKRAASSQNTAFVRTASEICRWHHERYDGSGYPDGLAGEQIPLAAQVVGLADTYESLTSGENGQVPYPPEAARYKISTMMIGKFSPILLLSLQEIGSALEAALAAPEKRELW